jgi:hypothetical protein
MPAALTPRYDRAMPERHFPPALVVEELDSCFVVEDANGQALAYMYFEISHSVMQHSNA